MAGVTDLEGNPIPDDVCPIHLVQYPNGFDCTACDSRIAELSGATQ